MTFHETDCEVIWSQIRQSEKKMIFKRRWLLGLPTFSSEQKKCDHADILENRYLPESFLREDDVFYDIIKLRVEEAFGALNFERKHHGSQDNMTISDARKIRKILLSSIDSLSNTGLYLIARTLTGDSIYFEKTRCKMKVMIQKFMAKAVRGHIYDCHQVEIFKQLSQLLGDIRNYQSPLTSLTHRSSSSRVAVSQVLDMLGDLPTESLFAMRRKLKEVRIVPEMKRHRHGCARDQMINLLLGVSDKILSALHEDDRLPEPFAKAMAVANLSLKLTSSCRNSSLMEFYEFSPKVKTLHDEIVKAIWMIKQKTSFPKLKKVKLLLDPNAKISNRSLRTIVRKMLMDFLFECSDMDTVPKSLLEALAMINRTPKSSSHKYLPKEEIVKEVDYILGLSAQLKQVYFDLLPYHDFNEDFAAAYTEELEESDENDVYSDDDDCFMQDDSCFHVSGSNCQVESMGESLPVFVDDELVPKGSDLSPLPAHTQRINVDFIGKVDPCDDASAFQNFQLLNIRGKMSQLEQANNMDFSRYAPTHRNAGVVKPPRKIHSNYRSVSQLDLDINAACSVQSDDPSLSYGFTQDIIDKKSICRNQYLTIQEICDETSMFAYNLIGQMIEEYAKMYGLAVDWNESLYLTGDHTLQDETQVLKAKQAISGVDEDCIIVQACEKLIHSFCKSTTESGLQYKDIKVDAGPSLPIGFHVAANYVAMVPSGPIFNSSLEKGQLYFFRVGSGRVIKGLDERILSMKARGKRRLYIPRNPIALVGIPKGINAAPRRLRVGPNRPVIFNVSLEYIPGLEFDEE